MNETYATAVKTQYSEFSPTKPREINQLTTRLASERDVDAIWNLYLKTNFLYPEKLAAMRDGGKKAKDTMERLLSLRSDKFQISMCENQSSELLAVCTYARYSAVQKHIMHLTSNGNIKGLLRIFKTNQEISARSPSDFSTYTFRPNNAGVRRLFVSVLTDVYSDFENESYDYYKFTVSDLRKIAIGPHGFQINEATENDRLYLIKHSADMTQRVVLDSIGQIGDATTLAVSDAFGSVGLARHRRVISIRKNGLLKGIAVAEIGPDWWNFSGLGTGIRLCMLEDDEPISRVLLAAASEFLSDYTIACWTMLVSPRQTALTRVLNGHGFFSQKQYQRITFPKSETRFVCDKYSRFIERGKGE